MKSRLEFLPQFFLILLISCAGSKSSDATRAELQRMHDEDQAMRNTISSEGMDAMMKDTALMLKMVHEDSLNTKRMKEMLGSSAWFTKEDVGKKGLEDAFILIQHSPDHEFQKRSLPYIEKQAKNGDVSMQDYALLLDRTLIFDNKPQIYGTQIQELHGEWVPYPIEDSLNVDKRRGEIGLFSMQQYMDIIKQYYKKSEEKK
jgi:hypothetical protein